MNTRSKISGSGWILAMLLGVGGIGAAHAQAATPIVIDSTAFQEVEVTAPDGTTSTKLEPAARIAPGAVVVYEISYRNEGAEPATNVAINNPVAGELVFLEASVEPTAVSVDGGKQYGSLETLTVAGADGAPRPARPSDVTNLRWTIASLAPNASGKVSFRARVK